MTAAAVIHVLLSLLSL